ncbi:MAG: Rieske (2Fe-2S) protein [Planctomycetota bacterium]
MSPSPSDRSEAPESTGESIDRRGFATLTVRALIGLPILSGLFAALRVGGRPMPVHGPERISLGPLADLPESGLATRTVRYRRRIGGRIDEVSDLVLVGREGESAIAMSTRCTHVGCRVTLDDRDAERPILCPCHDAAFDAQGNPLEGPASRPLDRLPIEVVGEGSAAEVFWLRTERGDS